MYRQAPASWAIMAREAARKSGSTPTKIRHLKILIAACQRRDPRATMGNKDKKNKKDAQLVLRLNKELRDEFVDACKDLDTSAAREIRRFIKRFMKRYHKGEFDE